MDEHKTQQPEPEIVPARRKSGRMRSWKASILACVICILVTALVTSLIFVGKFGGSRNYKLALKFAQVKQVVDKNYIGDADDTAISDAASSAIISAIGDKWSYYMTAEEYKAYQMYSNNEYAGIGVTIQLDDKTKGFRITAVTSDSPAAKAGLKQGDIILSIDGEDVTGKTLSEVQTIIRAKLNKTLKLTVQDTAGKSQTVTLDCTVIYTDPVTYKLMDNGVGYVCIRNFETGGGTRAVQAVDKLLDLCLILHADHGGGNNSAFTTRVVTSTGTDTYSAIASALCSLKGPRHGGANIRVRHMFNDLKCRVTDWTDDEQIEEYLAAILDKRAFDRSGLIYGMGHAVYSKSDPRATVLRSFVRALSQEKGREKECDLYMKVEEIAGRMIAEKRKIYKGVSANVDFYSGLVYRMLELPYELFTPIFAVSRIAGWSAHRIEEIQNAGKIIRPAYINVKPKRQYIPLIERK